MNLTGPKPWFHEEAFLDHIPEPTPTDRATARDVLWAAATDLFDYTELSDALGLTEGT